MVQVQAEQRSMRPDLNAPITGELLNKMTYTRQVREAFNPAAPVVLLPAASQRAHVLVGRLAEVLPAMGRSHG